MSRSEDAELAIPPPSDFRVRLVTFMPFVAFEPDGSLTDGGSASGAPVVEGLGRRSPDPNMWKSIREAPNASGSSTREDLRFWDYSDSLIEELTRQLPHRQWWLEIMSDDAPRLRDVDGGEWRPETCTAQLWNTGIGHLTSVFSLSPSEATSWTHVRDSVVGIEAKRELLIRGDVTVTKALAAGFDGPPGSGPTLATPGSRASRIQWVQHLFVVESPAVLGAELLDAVAAVVSDGGARLRCAVDTGQAEARLSVEACVVSNPGVTALRDALIRVISTQTSIWAAAIDLDRVLMSQLAQLSVQGHSLPLSDLEQRALASLNVFERVQRFRASVSTIGVHLGTVDKDVWGRVNEEWRLVDQLDSLEIKLTAVEHVQKNLIDTLSTRQGRALNQVVLLITLLSLASFLLAIWDFTHKDFDPLSWVSAAVVVLSVGGSLMMFGYLRRHLGRSTVGLRLPAGLKETR